MGAKKLNPSDLSKLYSKEEEPNTLKDKKTIETLKERLNQKIQKDQKIAKKAALIIEQWLKKTKP
jgi:hypothetical protein